MVNIVSSLRPLARDVARVDRSKISFVTPLRNAVGTAAPLAGGAATGHLLVGLAICIGALNVAFSDRPGPYGPRAGQMLLVSLLSAVSVFVGGAAGAIAGLAVVLAALWGFGGGLLVALGPAATQIGLTSMIMLIVFAARPLSPTPAAEQAGLILAGGLLQTLLAIAAWPVRRYGPQRAALAELFRQLAAGTHASRGPDAAPPATTAITDAAKTLNGVGSDHGAMGEAFRALLDETERIRIELLALDDIRYRRRDAAGQGAPRRIDEVMEAAGDLLTTLAEGLETGRPPARTDAPLQRIEAAARALRDQAAHDADTLQRTRAAAVLAGVDALAGQLRAAVRITAQVITGDDDGPTRLPAARRRPLLPRAAVAILRANLTLRSAACRHALRLACCFAFADALRRLS